MPDDHYLEGDPRAGRRADAEAGAVGGMVRARMLLEKLEAETLPAVDIERTPDPADPCRRVYK